LTVANDPSALFHPAPCGLCLEEELMGFETAGSSVDQHSTVHY
jgi:hypothetical protein